MAGGRKRIDDAATGQRATGGMIADHHAVAVQHRCFAIERDPHEATVGADRVAQQRQPAADVRRSEMHMHRQPRTQHGVAPGPHMGIEALRGGVQIGVTTQSPRRTWGD